MVHTLLQIDKGVLGTKVRTPVLWACVIVGLMKSRLLVVTITTVKGNVSWSGSHNFVFIQSFIHSSSKHPGACTTFQPRLQTLGCSEHDRTLSSQSFYHLP